VLLWLRSLQKLERPRKAIGNSRKLNPSNLWKHGLPTPGSVCIIWSLELKKTKNWHGDNQRGAIKLYKKLLYENKPRNNIVQFGKTKALKIQQSLKS
jgi:hypothetical protein